MPTCVRLLGVPIHAVTMAETLTWIEAAVNARAPRQICTANPEFLVTAQHDSEFHTVLNHADLVLPDGIGLLFAARWRGEHLPERVAGSDLIYRLAELAVRQHWRLYLLGAAEGVAERTAQVLQQRYPGLTIAGTYAGSPRVADEEAIIARICASPPDVLLVAYGAPAQDKWIARNVERLNVPVSMGVGGSFDFVAGVVRRAPLWAQRLNLEWLYRLWQQPWRVRRIFNATVVFIWQVWRERQKNRRR